MCIFFRCIFQGLQVQRVGSSRAVPASQMPGFAGEETVIFQRLQVIGQRTDGYAALTSQALLRRPATAILVGAVGKGHENQLAAPGQALVAGFQNG